jgi:hypothetical protein
MRPGMRIDSESFRGKLYLLVVDKLVIGAVIALAFVVYDLRRTADLQRYETQAKDVQLQFERAKLVREFMPLIAGREADVVTRAYVLRSAIAIGALDAEAGIELGRNLLADGLDDQTFVRVMAPTMPNGLPALARFGEQMSLPLRPISPLISGTFRPESVPPDLRGPLREARLWRRVIFETTPSFEGSYEPLEKPAGLSQLLYGLYVLLNPGDAWEAIDLSNRRSRGTRLIDTQTERPGTNLSNSRSRGTRLIGNLSRVLYGSSSIANAWSPEMHKVPPDVAARYSEAAARVESELLADTTSSDGIRYSGAIIRILADYGPPAGPIAIPLARLLVAPEPLKSLSESVQGEYRSLRWDAGELLRAMQRNPKNVQGFNGAEDAEPILVAFVQDFRKRLNQAATKEQFENLSIEYERGTRLRTVVELLGGSDSNLAKTELKQLRSEGSEKLRHFPQLEDDTERATRPR